MFYLYIIKREEKKISLKKKIRVEQDEIRYDLFHPR